jgi:methylamine--corrinoid protein Co-methyltransferase
MLLTTAFARTAGGPGTSSVLYETAALAIAAVSSGIALMEGVQAAVGTHQEHCSGLEARFNAEVTHAAEKLTRKQADPIVRALAAKYTDGLKSQPIGKPFEEVYELTTLKPLPEWKRLYDAVCEELVEMGLGM